MKCPVCDVDLSISAREGVEIDFCPQCRGVWLDRGELDKILDRVAATQAAPSMDPASSGGLRQPAQGDVLADDLRRSERDDRHYEDCYDDRRGYDPRYDKKRRRRGFLDDLFDF